jgi:glycosyltransferase involved in cell wall biosynthesis
MRIVLFSDTFSPQINGVARTLSRLAQHAVDRGHEVAVVTPRVTGGSADSRELSLQIALPGLPVPFYPELRLASPLDPWSGQRLHAFRPELVHVATEFTIGWSGVAWAERHGLPLVSSFHTDFPAYLAGYGLAGLERGAWNYLRAFHSRARLTFCPSTATRRQLLAAGFHDRIRLWPRGVDAGRFSPQHRSDRMRTQLAGGTDHLLLYVGRLAPEKRLDVLLSAWTRVHHALGAKVALAIVGDGPQAQELRARAPGNVTFTGYLEGTDLAAAYAAADLFVFPSDTETFGNVVLEALASGLPVIGPHQGGILDIVESGRTGQLVPPGDAAAFAAAVLALLEARGVRLRMAAAARNEAVRRGWDAVLDDVLATYASVCAARTPAAA